MSTTTSSKMSRAQRQIAKAVALAKRAEIPGTAEYAEAKRTASKTTKSQDVKETKTIVLIGSCDCPSPTCGKPTASASFVALTTKSPVLNHTEDNKYIVLLDVRGTTHKVLKSAYDAMAVLDAKAGSSRPTKSGESKSQAARAGSRESARPRWEPITDEYGRWCDEPARLNYIFDRSGKYTDVYEDYGYHSGRVDDDHFTTLSPEQRQHIIRAKKCFKMREQWQAAFEKTEPVRLFAELVRSSINDHAAMALGDDGDSATGVISQEADTAAIATPAELNAFLLWSVKNPILIPRGDVSEDKKTGGFLLRDAATGTILQVWREGTQDVLMNMHSPTNGTNGAEAGGASEVTHSATPIQDASSVISCGQDVGTSDRKEIFTFLGPATASIHRVFHSRTRKHLIDALTEFISEGWMVVPQSVVPIA